MHSASGGARVRANAAVAAVAATACERGRVPLSRRLLHGAALRLRTSSRVPTAAAGWGAMALLAPGGLDADSGGRPSVAASATAHGDTQGRPQQGSVSTAATATLPRVDPDGLAEAIVEDLRAAGVRCVAFDMDQTLVDRHSRGRLRKSKFDWFASHTTPAFLTLVPKLVSAGAPQDAPAPHHSPNSLTCN